MSSWIPDRSYDTIPMHALLFGATPPDLSRISGFSSDAKLRSFGIHFSDGTEERIGPDDANEHDRKVFKIDGAGGEKIVKVEIGMNQLPLAIKVTQLTSLFLSSPYLHPLLFEGVRYTHEPT